MISRSRLPACRCPRARPCRKRFRKTVGRRIISRAAAVRAGRGGASAMANAAPANGRNRAEERGPARMKTDRSHIRTAKPHGGEERSARPQRQDERALQGATIAPHGPIGLPAPPSVRTPAR